MTTTQVAGFVLADGGRRIAAFRWTPRRVGGDAVCVSPDERRLECPLPTASVPFLTSALRGECSSSNSFPVYVLDGSSPRHGQTLRGTFRVLEWHEKADPPHVVVLGVVPEVEQDAWRAWGLEFTPNTIRFPLPETDVVVVPDYLLFNALDDDAHAWCGAANRFGRSVLVILYRDEAHPPREGFQTARRLVAAHPFPLLLVCVPVGSGAVMQSVLFRPFDGANRRACFGPPGHLRLGEANDDVE